MPTKKGGHYSKISSTKTGKKRPSKSTQTVSKKKPTKEEFIAHLQNNPKFIFERGQFYKEVGFDGYKGAGVRSDVSARTEKGIKILGEWYPKKLIIYKGKYIYAPYWLILDKEIKYYVRKVDELLDEIVYARDKLEEGLTDEFTTDTPEEFQKRYQKEISDNQEYIRQYQKSIATKKYLKSLIDER